MYGSENKVDHEESAGALHLPAPTVWPMVLALGVTLVMAGLLTSLVISILGAVFVLLGSVGWFRNVLPHERHEAVSIAADEPAAIAAPGGMRSRPQADMHAADHYSLFAGIECGLAGGAAMAVVAILFSELKFHTPWFAINLLAAGGFVGWVNASNPFLSQFHLQGLTAAVGIHLLLSVLVGLLYSAILPMMSKRPMLMGGLVVPLIWTALAFSTMSSISPILSGRVNWGWFVVSQIAFGVVATLVLSLRMKINSPEFRALPFAVRAGLHTGGARLPRAPKNGDKS